MSVNSNKNDNPLVSVLIPCYNHQLFISDCLNSVIAQTYKNIEVIILDDCSTDDSFLVLKQWESKLRERFSRVIIEKNPENLGITKNLNKLVQYAKGDYLKPMASDDMLVPTCIEDLVLLANQGCDLVHSDAFVVKGEVHWENIDHSKFTKYGKVIPSDTSGLTNTLLREFFICAPTILYPRCTFEKYGLFDTSLSFEDWEYCLRVSTNGTIFYLDKPCVYYRYLQESASHFIDSEESRKKNKRFYIEKKKVFNTYKEYADQSTEIVFYNKQLAAAIVLYDKELAKEIVDEMKQKSIRIEFSNKVRIFLFKTGIYSAAKKMKHIFKR